MDILLGILASIRHSRCSRFCNHNRYMQCSSKYIFQRANRVGKPIPAG